MHEPATDTGTISVFVVDDHKSVRESLAFLLQCSGIEARSFGSADEALRAISANLPTCIVSDMRMPSGSGLDLLAEMRRLGIDTPVILMTGHADVPLAIQALRAGVADFIEKPFTDEAMLSAIMATAKVQLQNEEQTLAKTETARRLATLTGRERQVLDRLVEGKANKVIAHELDISARTVEVYRTGLKRKMGGRTLAELVRLALSVQ